MQQATGAQATTVTMEVLRTPRLRLRWFEPSRDAPFVLELLNDPDWIANIADAGVRDEAAARRWIEDKPLPRCWTQGHGFWLVERIADGEPLGLCGLTHRQGLPLPDLGYALLQRHRGQGYAREAARACLDYAERVLGFDELLATTTPGNTASGRVLLALGFADEGLQQTEAYEGLSQLYRWRGRKSCAHDAGEAGIRDLLARYWAAFDNRGGVVPPLAALPALFTAGARIDVLSDAGRVHRFMDLAEFLPSRAALLMPGGRLREFHEQMTEGTEYRQSGRLAQVWTPYRKQGWLDGQPYGGEGRKGFQLLYTQGRWRIVSMVWEDDAPRAAVSAAAR